MTPERIGIDTEALDEMYDAHGTIAREAAAALDALRVPALYEVDLAQLPALLREAFARVERIHAVAAAERERWYRAT